MTMHVSDAGLRFVANESWGEITHSPMPHGGPNGTTVLVIGCGHVITTQEELDEIRRNGNCIDTPTCLAYLRQDTEVVENYLNQAFNWTGIPQRAFDMLISLISSTGGERWERSIVKRMLGLGDLKAAGDAFLSEDYEEMFGVEVHSPKTRKRRERERRIFLGEEQLPVEPLQFNTTLPSMMFPTLS